MSPVRQAEPFPSGSEVACTSICTDLFGRERSRTLNPVVDAMKRLILVTTCLLLTIPGGLTGQEAVTRWDPWEIQMERNELESLLGNLEAVVRSSAYSERLRLRARRDADEIRDRLRRGDFRVGDRMVLQVEQEPNLPDTLVVEPGPQVTLPVMGTISLAGVLRSEIEEHLTQELSRFINDPVVRARALVRVAVQGSVGQPGFYTMPADMLVSDLIMRIGGPAENANLEEIRIERGGQIVLEGSDLQNALIEGLTLDQLNLRAGDQIHVPAVAQRPWWNFPLRFGIPVATSLLLGVRVFTGGF